MNAYRQSKKYPLLSGSLEQQKGVGADEVIL
jgi:hypothetical protein